MPFGLSCPQAKQKFFFRGKDFGVCPRADAFLSIKCALYRTGCISESQSVRVSSKTLSPKADGVTAKTMEAKLVKARLLQSVSWMLLMFVVVCSSAVAEESGKASSGATIFKSKCALCH